MRLRKDLVEQFITETPIEILTCKRCTENEMIRKTDEEKGFRDRVIEIGVKALIDEEALRQIRSVRKLDDTETSNATGFFTSKRMAKVGEYVLVVASDDSECNDYKNGDVLKIIHTANHHAYYKTFAGKYLTTSEYLVLINYIPEEGEL